MIKILNVISDTNIGGAGKVIINYAKNYDSSKYDVSIVLPKGSLLIEELKETKVKLIEIDGLKDKSLDIKAFFKLLKIFKKEKPDIVHTHASMTARIAARFVKGIKIVYTRHCAYPVSFWIKHNPGKFIYKFVNEFFADRIIAVGNAAEENLLEGGIKKDLIDTFFNGVDKLTVTSDSEKAKLKEKYKISPDEKVIGIVARLEEVKGHDTFIDAAKILLEEKKLKAKFFILGTGTIEESLKEKVKSLGLEDKIIFTGFVKNVGDYLNIFDLQVNCSYGTETSSLSLLEGMSIGVPACASNYGGNPYLIDDGENGYIFKIKDSQELAEKAMKILTDDDIKTHMQKRAVEIFDEKFTVQRFVNNVEGVYDKVSSEKRKVKLNPLDFIIILVILVMGFVGYKVLKRTNVVSKDMVNVTYSFRSTKTKPEVADMIEEGMSVYDSIKNYYIGKIVKKEVAKDTSEVFNEELEQYVTCESETEVSITLTINVDATVEGRNIVVSNEYPIKVGNEAFVKGKGFAAYGYIVGVERLGE